MTHQTVRPLDASRKVARGQLTFGFIIDLAPCAHTAHAHQWREMADGRAHLGRYCQNCGAWLGWVPQHGVTLRLAPPRPERAP
jgi:hypothetical protein